MPILNLALQNVATERGKMNQTSKGILKQYNSLLAFSETEKKQ